MLGMNSVWKYEYQRCIWSFKKSTQIHFLKNKFDYFKAFFNAFVVSLFPNEILSTILETFSTSTGEPEKKCSERYQENMPGSVQPYDIPFCAILPIIPVNFMPIYLMPINP